MKTLNLFHYLNTALIHVGTSAPAVRGAQLRRFKHLTF
jgi:hypothetical protein